MTDDAIVQQQPERRRSSRLLLIVLIMILLLALGGILWVLLSMVRAPQRQPLTIDKPGVKYEFAAFGGSFGLLDHPVGVAYDSQQGTIYATEPIEGRVTVYDEDGTNGRIFVDTKDYKVKNPTGIDVGPDGLIYVADPGLGGVSVFNTAGDLVRKITTKEPVAWVHVSGDRVYTLSPGTLYVSDLDGNALAQWGKFGRGLDELSEPSGVAVDKAGTMYVTDLNNYRVVALDPDFNRTWQVGATASTEASANAREFGGPSGLTIGSDGNIYFLDGLESHVYIVDKSGKLISDPLSEVGNTDDSLNLPRGIDSMGGDLFVIADTFHNRIVGLRLTPQRGQNP